MRIARFPIVVCFLIGVACGFVAAVLLRVANAAPSLPAFMVQVNNVEVHRFLDTSGEFAAVCYVADKNGASPAIACVRAKP